MKQSITLFTFICNAENKFTETSYMHTEVDMSSSRDYIYVGQQTVTVDVPDGDIQAMADAHKIEILQRDRLTLEEQQKRIDEQLKRLNCDDYQAEDN